MLQHKSSPLEMSLLRKRSNKNTVLQIFKEVPLKVKPFFRTSLGRYCLIKLQKAIRHRLKDCGKSKQKHTEVVSVYQHNINTAKVTFVGKFAGKLKKIFLHFSKTPASSFHHEAFSFPQKRTEKWVKNKITNIINSRVDACFVKNYR